MLYEFLAEHRTELVKRCREKVATRVSPAPTKGEVEFGVPLFLDQVIRTLRAEKDRPKSSELIRHPTEIGVSAGKHGAELLAKGFTVDGVVHSYGDICQSVTELAGELDAPIDVEEYRTFNRCLDDAIADAVTEFGRQRDQFMSADGASAMNQRLGFLAHDLRNLLNTAILAFEAIKRGNVAVTGATGAVLDRSLIALKDIIDRSLADVRLTAGLEAHPQPVSLREFFADLQVSAGLEARAAGIALTVAPVEEGLRVAADPQMLGSAVSNLLQNAIKFSRPKGHVTLTASATADTVVIQVADECGGLPPGKSEELFQPFEQRGAERGGLGLGLSISRRGVVANGGTLQVRDIPGKGCVFTIELPRRAAA